MTLKEALDRAKIISQFISEGNNRPKEDEQIIALIYSAYLSARKEAEETEKELKLAYQQGRSDQYYEIKEQTDGN